MRVGLTRVCALCLSCILSLVLVAPATGAEAPRRTARNGAGIALSLGVEAAASDDDIPGVPAPASPINDSLDGTAGTDVDDVYAISLTAGQILRVSLMGDEGTDFVADLYAPGTTSVFAGDIPLVSADTGAYPREFTYVASTTGTYYLDVCDIFGGGPGSFALTYEVLPADAGSDIPGLTGFTRPINGAFGVADINDVYAMNLVAGQSLMLNLQAPAGMSFGLYLYPPGSSSIFVNDEVASVTGPSMYDAMFYTVPVSGTYYLLATAFEGSGAYQIWVQEQVKPVVACEPLATYTSAASVAIAASDAGGSGLKSITYSLDGAPPVTVPGAAATVVTSVPGRHTLTATAADGCNNVSDPVTRTFSVLEPTTITLTKSIAAPAYGKPAMITATLRSAGSGAPIAGRWVAFEVWTGSGWGGISVDKTNESGTFTRGVYPRSNAKTTYRVRFADDTNLAASTSAPVVVTPKVSLSMPNAPTTMYKGKAKAISGYLKPRHAAGSYPVKIYKYRYVSGKWKSYGFVKAKAANYSTYTKYSKSLSLPYKGKWRLRAYSAADTKHAATWSSFDYVTVK